MAAFRGTVKTSGICAKEIDIVIEDDTVVHVEFKGGCEGNASGMRMLLQGMTTDEVIKRLDGITCGSRPTSCPDQLAKALKKKLQELKVINGVFLA